ncbi:TcaA second domain-containing protein [Lactiplantibacillus plajomi]|uniref:Zinc-ribbon domain-containing protein n=1 Tax=Lactiplantibacillus plajomi TaxID=1457217 RepID=A0ABV6K5U5_9LACO|nr:zinc-ribbon domain-containing protein [Lactiplantibacillus plajomi]
MKICPNCQYENAADAVFCGNCGAKLPEQVVNSATSEAPASETPQPATRLGRNQSTNEAPTTPLSQQRPKQPKKPWLVALLVVVLVVVAGGVFYASQFGKSKQVAAIATALADDDRTVLVDKVVSDDDGLTIDKQALAPLMTYLKNHPQYAKDAQADLKRNGHSSDRTLTIVSAGRQWLIVPVYKLQVTTMHPKVETNLKGAAITANDVKLSTTKYDHESYQAGPLMPGSYTFKLEGSAGSAKKQVDLMGQANVGKAVKLLTTTTTTSTDDVDSEDDDVDENDSDDTEDSNQHHTGKALSVLSRDAATAVSVMASKEDRDADDYTYVESQPWDNVTEIKLYDEDSDKLVDTYRYDKKNDILAKYDDATSKFVEVK